MIHLTYLTSLLVTSICLLLTDYKYKLAFWSRPKAAALTLTTGIVFFIAWDLCGIQHDVFFKGDSRLILPFEIVPESPVEELFFLFVLTYGAPLLFRGHEVWQARRP